MHPTYVMLFEMLMETVGASISFLTAYYSLKAFRLSGRRPLLYLHFGFTVLGVSMMSRVFGSLYIISAIAMPVSVRDMVRLVSTVCGVMRVVSYGLFAAAYSGERRVEMAVFIPLLVNPYTEFVCVAVMVYVVVQSAINHAFVKTSESLLVFVAFLLMLLSHVMFVMSHVRAMLYLVAHVFQLAGFISMLTMLLKVGREVGEG